MNEFIIVWLVLVVLLGVVVFFLVYRAARSIGEEFDSRLYRWSCPEPDCPLEVATSHVELLTALIEAHRKQDHS